MSMASYGNGDHKQGPSAHAYTPTASRTTQGPAGIYGTYQLIRFVFVIHVRPPFIPVVVVPAIHPQRSAYSLIRNVFTWALILVVGPHILVSLWRSHRHHIRHGHYWDLYTSESSADNSGVPDDVHLNHCVQANEWELLHKTNDVFVKPSGTASHTNNSSSSQIFFSLPIDSDALFFLSKGILPVGLSIGLINITTSPDQTHDAVLVRVVANYYEEEVRDSAKVCRISRNEGENGVGIFLPKDIPGPHGREGHIFFHTTVIVPETANSATFIKKLETDIGNTLHSVDDIGTKVLFDTVQFVGSTSGVHVKSLTTNRLDIRMANGVINGSFSGSNHVVLETGYGPINVDIGLRSTKVKLEPVLAVVRTSNADLQARFSLLSSESGGSVFNITTETVNSALQVEFLAAPVNSKLHYKGRTSNSPAIVSLNPAYEGMLDVKTSFFSTARVKVDDSVQDPTGKGRSRDVLVFNDRSHHRSTGYVRWGDEDPNTLGSVELITSVTPAEITL